MCLQIKMRIVKWMLRIMRKLKTMKRIENLQFLTKTHLKQKKDMMKRMEITQILIQILMKNHLKK